MIDWVQNVSLQVDTTQFLKFKRRYLQGVTHKFGKNDVLKELGKM